MNRTLDALKQGMSTELWGRHFYEQAAARTRAEDGQKVFQSLIREEEDHLDILRGRYAALSGEKSWVTMDEARALASSVDPADIFPQADADVEDALRLAMDFERRGYEQYTESARKATSDAEREMWEYLVRAEDQHFAFLQETYEYLSNNGVWYYDDQERPFFEG